MTKEDLNSISLIIPVYNEKDSLKELLASIKSNLSGTTNNYEIIFIDDGSTDGSTDVILDLCSSNKNIRLAKFSTNQGKAEALNYGFSVAENDIIITLDADLQDDPSEIPNFIAKIKEGHDLVSGWKTNRQDPLHKTLPSRLFNFVVRKTFSMSLHDFNCGFKAYRRDLIKKINIYGELHRYIPVLAKYEGARIAEISVKHNPRQFGKSKYGTERLIKGFLDLVTIIITTRFLKRPLHFFGTIGVLFCFLGGLGLAYLATLWIMGCRPIGNRPLLLFSILSVILGAQVFSLGVMAELFIRLNQKPEKPSLAITEGFPEKI